MTLMNLRESDLSSEKHHIYLIHKQGDEMKSQL